MGIFFKEKYFQTNIIEEKPNRATKKDHIGILKLKNVIKLLKRKLKPTNTELKTGSDFKTSYITEAIMLNIIVITADLTNVDLLVII